VPTDQVLLNQPQVEDDALDYNLTGLQELVIQAATATFDGTGASGDYLPALQIIGPGGVVGATFVDWSNRITAGDSVEVTFGTFLRAATSSGGGGIQFDVDNSGDWLQIETTDSGHTPSVAFTTAGEFSVVDTSGFGSAITLHATNSGNVGLLAEGTGEVQIIAPTIDTSGTTDIDLDASSSARITGSAGGLHINHGSNTVSLDGGSAAAVKISCDTIFGTFGIQIAGSTSQKVGFYGATPITQQGTPTTLADVIAILRNLGLCA